MIAEQKIEATTIVRPFLHNRFICLCGFGILCHEDMRRGDILSDLESARDREVLLFVHCTQRKTTLTSDRHSVPESDREPCDTFSTLWHTVWNADRYSRC